MKGLTANQLEMLQVVGQAGREGDPVDLDQLLEQLSWKPTKEAVQFTIRAVIGKGLMVKEGPEYRRGRRRVLYRATEAGFLALDPRATPPKAVIPAAGPAAAPKTDNPSPAARPVVDPELPPGFLTGSVPADPLAALLEELEDPGMELLIED